MACVLSNDNYQQNLLCIIREDIPYITVGECETVSNKVDLQKFTCLFGEELRVYVSFPDQIPGPVFYKFSDNKQRKNTHIQN